LAWGSIGPVVNFGRKAIVSQYGENAILVAGDAAPIFAEAPARDPRKAG